MADPANGTYQMFESIKQANPYGSEYWSARELMPLLGYDQWRRFDDAIERAKVACGIAGQSVEDHFAGAGKMIALPKGAQREVKDYYLSRFACYLIAMNGDPRKPEIAGAQAYFAVQTRKQELFEQLPDMEKRLLVRERVMDGNTSLSQTAHEAGVRSRMFGVFHDAGYKGLYGGLGVQDIKERKGIGAKEDVLDRMGRAELAANEFRITQTEQKLKNKQSQGEQEAIETHHEVGREVRDTIARLGGTMPEDLPTEPSIRPLIDHRARERKQLPPGAPE
ncbi:MAG: DNA damage-inducible protein D, partial [Ktedonobacterales bacterium]